MSPLTLLDDAARQARVTDEVRHRPWPIPENAWVQGQSWIDLAFLHWSVEAAGLQPLVPTGPEVETDDGTAWLGITPFWRTGFRRGGRPPLPRLSTFEELNVRTYA